jgi:phage baseplate assembly protein W
MENHSKDFMGRGWAFPIGFDPITGDVNMLSGEEDIQDSLKVLFATQVGERVMQPDYGSELDSFLFMPMNKSTLTYMQSVISDAILFYEPRIVLEDVTIEPAGDTSEFLNITIRYRVSATNNRYNFVYPFYIKEATNLER